MSKIGDRVGAILSGNDKKVNFLGYGKYVGDTIPNEAVGFLAEGLKEHKRKNPRIELDSGKVVYGCECWWGDEDAVKKQLEGREIVNIDIDKKREEYRKE